MTDHSLLYFQNLFDPKASEITPFLQEYSYPWEILPDLKAILLALGEKLEQKGYRQIQPQIWTGENTAISPTAELNAPCIIGHGTEIRHCAYIRGSVIIGNNCVVGNSTELKNAILFDRVQVPHYNYIGDSILGKGAHLGAGSVISNLKSDGTTVKITVSGEKLETGMRKLGAMVGDGVEAGCGCVLNSGTIIGRGSRIYPLNSVRGVIPAGHVYKSREEIIPIR